jgi:rSAM/selenodomain-associated transferase 1
MRWERIHAASPAAMVPTPLPDAPRIAVFAKAPVAGAVKTRLVPTLGADGAARLHEALALHALATATQVKPSSLELWCAPDAAHPFFAGCAARFGCRLRVQRGADLGARMADAFAHSAPLVLIGTDCPALTASHLVRAWQALAANDAALAPAEDGGYVLIALARAAPSLFLDMAWGDAGVMARTRERIAAAGMRCAELETLWDVDRPADYARLQESGIAMEVPA